MCFIAKEGIFALEKSNKIMTTITEIQIRFADTDMLRHVNNVNLQHYFDLGKGDLFRPVLGGVPAWGDKAMITASTTSSYFEQTRYEDNIYVESTVEKIGTKSITIVQRLINRVTHKVHAESRSVMVAYNFETQQSISVPDDWRSELI